MQDKEGRFSSSYELFPEDAPRPRASTSAPRAPRTYQGNAEPQRRPRRPGQEQFAQERSAYASQRAPQQRKPKKKQMPVWKMIVIDVLAFGVALLTFAYFHHVMPSGEMQGTKLPTPITSPEPQTTPDPQKTPEPQKTPAPIGDFSEKWADKFIQGEPQKTENSYISENVNVTLTKHDENGVVYYVQDIYVRDIKYLKTAWATGKFQKRVEEWTLEMAVNNNAVSAISGDSAGLTTNGVIVRNGELYQETIDTDICQLNYDGKTMQTFGEKEYDLKKLKAEGAWQVWSFGPMLLDANGQTMEKFNSIVNPKNPRSAIGYYEPGHYCFVVVDGRQTHSAGLTLKEMSQLFYDLGCKAAYNLDGGRSAAMVFGDKIVSSPYDGGRRISDIVMVADE